MPTSPAMNGSCWRSPRPARSSTSSKVRFSTSRAGRCSASCWARKGAATRSARCRRLAAGRVSCRRHFGRNLLWLAGRPHRTQADDGRHDPLLFALLGAHLLRDLAVASGRAAVSGGPRHWRRVGRRGGAGGRGVSGPRTGAARRASFTPRASSALGWPPSPGWSSRPNGGMRIWSESCRRCWCCGSARACASPRAGNTRHSGGRPLGSFRELFGVARWARAAILGALLAGVGLGTFWGVTVAGQDLTRELLRANGVSAADAAEQAKFAYGIVQTAGGGLGLLCFGPLAEWLGRRPAFAVMHVLRARHRADHLLPAANLRPDAGHLAGVRLFHARHSRRLRGLFSRAVSRSPAHQRHRRVLQRRPHARRRRALAVGRNQKLARHATAGGREPLEFAILAGVGRARVSARNQRPAAATIAPTHDFLFVSLERS